MAQAKVITDPETFKPITLQITLETQGEVNALYAVTNAALNEIELAIKHGRGAICNGYNIDFSSATLSCVKRSIYHALKPIAT